MPPNSAMFWNVRAMPSAAIFSRPGVGDVAAFEGDRTAVGPVEPADHVEQRGLAGAVGTDDRGDLAALDRDRHVLDRPHAAEPLRYRRGGKQNIVGRQRRSSCGFTGHAASASPRKFGCTCNCVMAGMMLTQSRECNHLRSGALADPAASRRPLVGHRDACRQPRRVKRSAELVKRVLWWIAQPRRTSCR